MQSHDYLSDKMDRAYPNKNMKRGKDWIGLGRSQLWGINTFTKRPRNYAIIAALTLTKLGNLYIYATLV